MKLLHLIPFVRTRRSVLPGYHLSMTITLLWLGIIVLLPLAVLVISFFSIEPEKILSTLTNPRVTAAFYVSVTSAIGAACIASIIGLLVAWVLVRYQFPGRSILDALVDMPFALPTAVAGIALSAIYAPDGWVGSLLQPLGIELAFNRAGIWLALTFIGLPFVVRSLEPVLEQLDIEAEEAAGALGAGRLQTFRYVLFPQLFPALISGFSLAFARGLGEYGSVIFLAGNVPQVSEIVPLVIVTSLEGYDMEGATVVAVAMLLLSFVMLYAFNALQHAQRKHMRAI